MIVSMKQATDYNTTVPQYPASNSYSDMKTYLFSNTV